MLLEYSTGETGELISFAFFESIETIALVKVKTGALVEWKISRCRVVEERRPPESAESPATDRQQLKADSCRNRH